MARQTTCCCSLRTGVIVVVSIFIVVSSLIGIAISVPLLPLVVEVIQYPGAINRQPVSLIAGSTFFLLSVIYILLGILLLVAVKKNSTRMATTFLVCTGIMFVIRLLPVLGLIYYVATSSPYPSQAARDPTVYIFFMVELTMLITHVYGFSVVYRFRQQLKTERSSGEDEEHIPMNK